MRRTSVIWWFLGAAAVALIAISRSQLDLANRRDRDHAELILNLSARTLASQVDPRKPAYDAGFVAPSGGHFGRPLVLLYDLAGGEAGRAAGSDPVLRLNASAARLVPAGLLRPMSGETPLAPAPPAAPELAEEPGPSSLEHATDVLGSAWLSEMKGTDGRDWLVATAPVRFRDASGRLNLVSAWIQAALPLDEVLRASRERTVRFLVFWAAAGSLTLLAALWSIRGRVSLAAVAEAADRMQIAKLSSTRLPETVDDPEALRLVRACNRLIDRVAEIHAGQQRFVADAAHELRTPLTILRGEIQVALREPGNHPLLIDTLRSNLDESLHLSRLIDSLLTLARADAGTGLGKRAQVDPADPVRRVLQRLGPIADERGVTLKFTGADERTRPGLFADPAALERILLNLAENAVKHSPAGNPVELILSVDAGEVRFKVVDRGIGIAPEHLPRIFDRFYRIDAARRRMDGGAGLGLAIVKTLVEAHGGSVSVESEVGTGSRFTIVLPRSTRDP